MCVKEMIIYLPYVGNNEITIMNSLGIRCAAMSESISIQFQLQCFALNHLIHTLITKMFI